MCAGRLTPPEVVLVVVARRPGPGQGPEPLRRSGTGRLSDAASGGRRRELADGVPAAPGALVGLPGDELVEPAHLGA